MDVSDLWRALNALLALIAAAMIAKNLISRWAFRKPRMRLMSMSLLALLLVVVEGSLEQMKLDTPVGLRTALATAACIWVIFAWLATEDDYSEYEVTPREKSVDR